MQQRHRNMPTKNFAFLTPDSFTKTMAFFAAFSQTCSRKYVLHNFITGRSCYSVVERIKLAPFRMQDKSHKIPFWMMIHRYSTRQV